MQVVAQNGIITANHDQSFIIGVCKILRNGRPKLSKYNVNIIFFSINSSHLLLTHYTIKMDFLHLIYIFYLHLS